MDINKLYGDLISSGNDWADKKAAYQVLDDSRQTVLARLTLNSTASSVAAREVEARASGEYETHIKVTQEAFKAYLVAQVKYHAIQTWIDLQRSAESTKRAEMKML